MKGYTAIEGLLTSEVPLASYMLYNEFKPADVAYFQKFLRPVHRQGYLRQEGAGGRPAVQGLIVADSITSTTSATAAPAVKPWAAPTNTTAPPRASPWGKLLPFVGPIALFIIWDLVVRFGLIKAILLPSPSAAMLALVTGLAGGPLLTDFLVTLMRTLEAFLIAAVVGMPLGVLLGSNEKSLSQR